jgi:hypothetical protein
MKTKEQIMEETFEFYSDSKNRAVRPHGGCWYLDVETGNKCAVGRCLDPNAEIEKLDQGIQNCWLTISKLLLPEYQGHNMDFWECLQYWHDSQRNFDKNKETISCFGFDAAKTIWKRYSKSELPEILQKTEDASLH